MTTSALHRRRPRIPTTSPDAIRLLRERRVVLPAGDRQTVSAVSYLGDAAFVSLTHVRVPPSMPLAAEVLRYQKHRVKKLRQQGKG